MRPFKQWNFFEEISCLVGVPFIVYENSIVPSLRIPKIQPRSESIEFAIAPVLPAYIRGATQAETPHDPEIMGDSRQINFELYSFTNTPLPNGVSIASTFSYDFAEIKPSKEYLTHSFANNKFDEIKAIKKSINLVIQKKSNLFIFDVKFIST